MHSKNAFADVSHFWIDIEFEFHADTLEMRLLKAGVSHDAKFVRDNFIAVLYSFGFTDEYIKLCVATTDSAAVNLTTNIDRQGVFELL